MGYTNPDTGLKFYDPFFDPFLESKSASMEPLQGPFGFIGLGAMGYAMASNIRKKLPPTIALYVNDVNTSVCERFVAEHLGHGPIFISPTARDVAENAVSIVSIVPAARHVEAVYLDGRDGVIAAGKNENRLMLECSTIDVQSTRDVGWRLLEAGAGTFIDTPVSGGVPGAVAGTLSFLIGRAPPDLKSPSSDPFSARLESLMLMMGSAEKFFYCGQQGAGLAAKIANNYLAGVHLLAAAEAMNFGIRNGVDRHLLYQVIHNSTGQSFMLDHVCPVPGVVEHAPSSKDYAGGFKAQMMVKDMTLGVEAAEAAGVRPTTGKAALELYREASTDERCVDRDVSVVYRFLGGPE